MNYFETTAEVRSLSRDERRRRMVSHIRGWLRAERSPRLTIVALLALSAAFAIGIGYFLAACGIRGWGTRAFWSVLAAWPAFVWTIRWRAGVEFRQLTVRESDRDAHFRAIDESAEDELFALTEQNETEREIYRGAGRAMGNNILTLLLLGGLTLGCWLIWDLIRTGPTLLAETIFDAEVVLSRSELMTRVTHRDWRSEAFGLTGIHFGGLAVAAGCVGWVLPYFALYCAR